MTTGRCRPLAFGQAGQDRSPDRTGQQHCQQVGGMMSPHADPIGPAIGALSGSIGHPILPPAVRPQGHMDRHEYRITRTEPEPAPLIPQRAKFQTKAV